MNPRKLSDKELDAAMEAAINTRRHTDFQAAWNEWERRNRRRGAQALAFYLICVAAAIVLLALP